MLSMLIRHRCTCRLCAVLQSLAEYILLVHSYACFNNFTICIDVYVLFTINIHVHTGYVILVCAWELLVNKATHMKNTLHVIVSHTIFIS